MTSHPEVILLVERGRHLAAASSTNEPVGVRVFSGVPCTGIDASKLVLRDLANLRVDDDPEVGSSVLLIGVAWIQSNFEPMRKQVALFEL